MRKLTVKEVLAVSGGAGCGPSLGGFLLYMMTSKICCGGECYQY